LAGLKEHKRIIGDTWLPLNAIISVNGNPLDITDLPIKFVMENQAGNEILPETDTGIVKQPTKDFTVDTQTGLLHCNDHGVQEGDRIVLSSEDTLPDGLSEDVRYYAKCVTQDNFALSLRPDLPEVVISDEGLGTHSFEIVGFVQFSFPDDVVDVAGEYPAWFVIVTGGKRETFPNDEDGITVIVAERGATAS